jgi:NADH-quinone oxidoreductase subunit J
VNPILFWILAAIAVGSAAVTITRRSPLASALALAVCLLAIAGLFAGLDAHLLFALQILVYAGAIIVLIVFVIMLLNLADADLEAMKIEPRRFVISAAVCALGCLVSLRAVRGLPELWAPAPASFGTAEQMGIALFRGRVIELEIVGLILLVGILGAVVLAKRGE